MARVKLEKCTCDICGTPYGKTQTIISLLRRLGMWCALGCFFAVVLVLQRL
jgi:hypothetical protein